MTARIGSLVMSVQIMAGTDDSTAAVDLQMLATDMGVIVEAKQRGITMRAFPGKDWQHTLREFERDERLSNYPD